MNLIKKLKEKFFNKKQNNSLSNTEEFSYIYNENKKLKELNTVLENKNKELELKITKLQNEISLLKETSNIWAYSSTDQLPKQEPIRSNRPKRNRNNYRKNYKEKTISTNYNKRNKRNEIKYTDIPKPGSHNKIEFN